MTFKSKIKKKFEVKDVHVIKCWGIEVLKQMDIGTMDQSGLRQ